MGKPRMIILIRHAQSEGNKSRDIHQTVPDHRVKLTPDGWKQAQDAGRRLRALLRPDDTLHFFTSPYRRARETTEGILTSLTSDNPSPSPFPRHTIKVYEEPRLREQDFGNFQPSSAEMERMWHQRADYGHFFYRIPNGESAADAYDRVSGFNESLWRYFGEDDFASVCVLVTHGLMTRVFLMKWYHFSVEYFEDLRNVNHCEFVVMKKNQDNGKFILQNKLRTWSELKRERALEKAREGDKPVEDGPVAAAFDPPVPIRHEWAAVADGNNHSKRGKARQQSKNGRRRSLNNVPNIQEEERQEASPDHTYPSITKTDKANKASAEQVASSNKARSGGAVVVKDSPSTTDLNEIDRRKTQQLCRRGSIEAADPEQSITAASSPHGDSQHDTLPPLTLSSSCYPDSIAPSATDTNTETLSVRSNGRDNKSENSKNGNGKYHVSPVDDSALPRELIQSPSSMPLYLLHLGGRDGGGSQSGVTSCISSDNDAEDEDEDASELSDENRDDSNGNNHSTTEENQRAHRRKRPSHRHRDVEEMQSRSIAQAIADSLGDKDDGQSGTSNNGGELDDEEEAIHEAAKKYDQSIEGSVY